MIKVRGRKAIFTGKHARQIHQIAADLGLSEQEAFTGILWEHIMRSARSGVLKEKK